MFKGFKVSGLNFDDDHDLCNRKGREVTQAYEKQIRSKLDSFTCSDGAIDGSSLQGHWFPRVDADIFLSHSHGDLDLALSFAGWIQSEFNLKVFIDWCVWGYADNLLKQIDSDYCMNPGRKTYDYAKRNGSTSHVHMMLATALGMMIDNTEALFFLETPSSITAEEAVKKTCSPWLFAEIAMANIVRRKTPQFHRRTVNFAESVQRQDAHRGLKINYSVDTDSLVSLDTRLLNSWRHLHEKRNQHGLDSLYEIVGLKEV
jgi:hypothetical protein